MSTVPLCEGPARSCAAENPVSTDEAGDEALLDRFVRDSDQRAFAALVHRHGPMVLGVCQRVLQNRHEAEDAFQATFLVLVRRATSLREPRLLAGWLYGVAYRVAQKALVRAARRDQHERERPRMAAGDPLDAAASRELRDLLDAELNSLPEKYRAALVLCYLEGKTNIEAARELGWPIGSVSARLARGRELLRERLSRRHPALSSSAVPLLLTGFLKPACVGHELVAETLRVALEVTGQTLAGIVEPAENAASPPLTGTARWPVSIVLLVLAVFALAGGLIAGDWFSTHTEEKEPPASEAAVVAPLSPLQPGNAPKSPCCCQHK